MGTIPTEMFILSLTPVFNQLSSPLNQDLPVEGLIVLRVLSFRPTSPRTNRPTDCSPSFLPTRGFISDVPIQQRRIPLRRIQNRHWARAPSQKEQF